jgi:transposase
VYKSKEGIRINADCNGAANILRKVAVNLRLSLEGISRGALDLSENSQQLLCLSLRGFRFMLSSDRF